VAGVSSNQRGPKISRVSSNQLVHRPGGAALPFEFEAHHGSFSGSTSIKGDQGRSAEKLVERRVRTGGEFSLVEAKLELSVDEGTNRPSIAV
jgi:hypothetical protein